MTDQPLTTLLDKEAAAGRLDSSGSFGLDRLSAVRKRRQFTTRHPYDYLLALVRSAVLSDAVSIQIHSQTWDVSFRHDGHPLSRQQLESLAAPISHPLRSSHELALALSSALGAGFPQVRVISMEKEECHQLTLGPGASSLESTVNRDGSRGIRVEVRKAVLTPLLDWTRHVLVGGGLKDSCPESAIAPHCRHCPVPISINGRAVPAAKWHASLLGANLKRQLSKIQGGPLTISPLFEGGDRLAQRFFQPVADSLDLMRGDFSVPYGRSFQPVWPDDHEIIEVSQDWREISPQLGRNRSKRMLAYLALEVAMEPLAELTWVRHGIVVGKSRVDLGCPGVVGVVALSGLDLDLDGAAPVQNDKYEPMLAFLRAQLEPLREEVLEHWTLFPPALGQHLRQALQMAK